jgi:tyrosinase
MPPAPALRTRKNQFSLSSTERARYVAALLKMKTDGIYDWYVQTHIDSMWMLKSGGMPMWAHMRPAFLPWHRQFILDFENDMRAADTALTGKPSDLALPYWNWMIDRSSFPYLVFGWVWQNDFMGPNGSGADSKVSDGPFKGWAHTYDAGPDYTNFNDPPHKTFLQRTLGKGANTLPTEDEWNAAKAITIYDSTPFDSNVGRKPHTAQFAGVKSFRNALEGWVGYYQDAAAAAADPAHTPSSLHNRVHVWVGGSMAPLSSPNDPVFFLHHCNVDRLWGSWQNDNPTVAYKPADGEPNPTDPAGENVGSMNSGPNEVIDLKGHHPQDAMPPWDGRPATRTGTTGNMPTIKPADVLNHIKLGYRYDTDPPSLTATGTP